MSDITSDTYWAVTWPWIYNSGSNTWTGDYGYFPNFGEYSPPFGATHISSRLTYSGESLIGKTLSVHTTNIGIIVNYSSNIFENSGGWGTNEGYDADYVQTIDGIANITITKDVYCIGVLLDNEYTSPSGGGYEDHLFISGIYTTENQLLWTNFRNTVEITT